MSAKLKSNGGPSVYYDFPDTARTLNDLIEFKRMSFAHGNIFKAAFRLGNKKGISLEYDLTKIVYYALRMLSGGDTKLVDELMEYISGRLYSPR